MDIGNVGVVGAGVMGVGVAQALAQTGHRVLLLDRAAEPLERAERELRRNLRLHRLLAPGKDAAAGAQASPDAVLSRICFSTDPARLADVHFVIENVPEKWEIKRELYPRLDAVCAPGVVFAVNTSAISITRVAALTQRPAQVIGIHFMNPVPLKPTAEVIRGFHTSDETVATAKRLLDGMGKKGVVVRDSPGFVSNRVLMLTVNEAIGLVQDGVAEPEEIDRIFRECFGHKMGPLETADLIGLDTILYSIDVLYESFRDSKYRPYPLLQKMVDAGLHGRKSGRGFFVYGPSRAADAA
jgi:3-hydroxybutyryl-CoA dehydrogenase